MKKRPVFLRMLDDAREGKVDVILVWRIDRFARSMKDFVLTTLDLNKWKVRLISVTENVDMKRRVVVLLSLLSSLALSAADIVEFPSGDIALHGVLYKPDGPGPFPAVVYNHGSAAGMLSKEAFDALGPVFATSDGTIRLMKEIDEVIDKHGGWPRAFQNDVEPRSETKIVSWAGVKCPRIHRTIRYATSPFAWLGMTRLGWSSLREPATESCLSETEGYWAEPGCERAN